MRTQTLLRIRHRNTPLFHRFDEAAENNICADMLRASASSVKVIFETDGDLAMSGYTRIALRCSAGILVPMEVGDFVGYKRLATLCEVRSLINSR
jgi:hypothetical protein